MKIRLSLSSAIIAFGDRSGHRFHRRGLHQPLCLERAQGRRSALFRHQAGQRSHRRHPAAAGICDRGLSRGHARHARARPAGGPWRTPGPAPQGLRRAQGILGHLQPLGRPEDGPGVEIRRRGAEVLEAVVRPAPARPQGQGHGRLRARLRAAQGRLHRASRRHRQHRRERQQAECRHGEAGRGPRQLHALISSSASPPPSSPSLRRACSASPSAWCARSCA